MNATLEIIELSKAVGAAWCGMHCHENRAAVISPHNPLVAIHGQLGFAFDGKRLHVRLLVPLNQHAYKTLRTGRRSRA